MKLLFVIDMQNDFIDGVLGSPEAQAIVPKVIEKIKQQKDIIVYTQDTHKKSDYLQTEEGKHLPIPHCLLGEDGWNVRPEIYNANKNQDVDEFVFRKTTFGYPWNFEVDFNYEDIDFTLDLKDITEIEIIGLDTDFCVLANAMTLKAAFPNVPITIDAACCAGSTPEWHEKALDMLEHCHFNVINRKKE